MIKKLGLIFGLLAAAPLAYGLSPRTFEDFGVQTTFSAKTSTTATYNIVGIPVRWRVQVIGGTADFTVGVSSGDQANGYSVLTSSTIYAVSSGSQAVVSAEYRSLSYNPVLIITRIDSPGATAYVTVDYLYPRLPSY